MKKATHIGECQICGRVQKLPGGSLSNHGYTKRWGFFSGICPGAGHNPFETHRDRIEGAIAGAKAAIEQHLQAAAAIRAQTDAYGWYSDHQRGVSVWREVIFTGEKYADGELAKLGWEKVSFSLKASEVPKYGEKPFGIRSAYSSGFYEGHTALEVAKASRERFCKATHDKQVSQLRDYVRWQEQRLKDWAPKPLKPVAE